VRTAKTACVLLISPGIIKWTDTDFGLPHLVSLGGYVQEQLGVRVEIIDLAYEGGDHFQLSRTLDELGPYLVIGLSCYSSFDYMRVMALARFLKDRHPETPLVGGGYHASALPTDLVFDGSPFDAVVVGEGERPLTEIVATILGGGRLDRRIYGPDPIVDLDSLPPYRWQLLGRYLPRARDLGRKLQIYLSRGCPYHCTFCMERAKSGHKWRAYGVERALDELRRLFRILDPGEWLVNVADPLFGFRRTWRREVLEGIVHGGLLPRQYWSLTRADDLDRDDIRLLAAARFSIGIGLESGCPDMLVRMRKGGRPQRYLEAIERLADLSLEHGLTWATNIVVGHPGETTASMQRTRDFVARIFTTAPQTRGWLSVDPFRLYPGSQVHEQMESYERVYGTRFFSPTWWKRWYDASFLAEHLDPGEALPFEERVRFMMEAYAPLLREIGTRFRGQGRDIDRVFRNSIEEQIRLVSPEARDRILRRATRAKSDLGRGETAGGGESRSLHVPLGLQIRDEWVRRREQAIRRLLEDGVLRTDALVEALLQVAPERHMSREQAEAVLSDRPTAVTREGDLPVGVGLRTYAIGLQALEPAERDHVVDMTAQSGYLSAVLAHLVGPLGKVVALHAGHRISDLQPSLAALEQVEIVGATPADPLAIRGTFDRLWMGAALPRFPARLTSHLRDNGGRAVAFLGPRFRRQDLVLLVRHGSDLHERIVARVRVPVVAAPEGWIPRPRPAIQEPTP
jgi:radical SAM superfamily enzyme YgiQ (UPF0313 family)/protein-L-isoaspartate O-methyltransferase